MIITHPMPRPSVHSFAALVLLATSCSVPEVARPEPEVVRREASVDSPPSAGTSPSTNPPTPAPPAPASAAPPAPAPTPALPPAAITLASWGAPLVTRGRRKGLRWATTAHLERKGDDAVDLVLDTELHNSTRKPMPVSLAPPLASIMTTAAPGAAGKGYSGLGMRGEGMGSDVCSPGHGGPTMLAAGERRTVQRRVELDPLPWPEGAAFQVTASLSDCRPGRARLEVAHVMVVPPASTGIEPTIVPAPSK